MRAVGEVGEVDTAAEVRAIADKSMSTRGKEQSIRGWNRGHLGP